MRIVTKSAAIVPGSNCGAIVRVSQVVIHVDRRHLERETATFEAKAAEAAAAGQSPPERVLQPSIFGRFAAEWFQPLVDAVIGGVESPEAEGLHYMLVDVCATVLGWQDLFPVGPLPRDLQPAARALLGYLVRYQLMRLPYD